MTRPVYTCSQSLWVSRATFGRFQFYQDITKDGAFGRGFAAAMLSPVDTVGHQLNRGRINRMDGSLETPGQAGI